MYLSNTDSPFTSSFCYRTIPFTYVSFITKQISSVNYLHNEEYIIPRCKIDSRVKIGLPDFGSLSSILCKYKLNIIIMRFSSSIHSFIHFFVYFKFSCQLTLENVLVYLLLTSVKSKSNARYFTMEGFRLIIDMIHLCAIHENTLHDCTIKCVDLKFINGFILKSLINHITSEYSNFSRFMNLIIKHTQFCYCLVFSFIFLSFNKIKSKISSFFFSFL